MAKRLAGGFEARPMASINMTPMVPVLLTLLAVVAATLSTPDRSSDLELQPAVIPPGNRSKPHDVIYLSARDGRYFLGEDEVALAELTPRLKALASSHEGERVYLDADKGVPYGQVLMMVQKVEAADMRLTFVSKGADTKR
jgi:biopolymer transport protein ExbD